LNKTILSTHLEYRTDIDGLRAIAVTSVILFHLGYLTNGYLGVDIFFVISGFLITSIIYTSASKKEFSLLKFYERRIRRIIPLLLFICLTALILGIAVMLPEDLENLSQSVIASNLSINNILMYITSGNYWATKNEFKPLMHTWSLGVEEQYYLIYPFIFYFFQSRKTKLSVYLIIALTLLSLLAFIIQNDYSSKFYLIQYRFFELSIGGLGAIYLYNLNSEKPRFNISLLYLSITITILLVAIPISSIKPFLNILITLSTGGILLTGSQYFNKQGIYNSLFGNKVIVGIGKISFSVYMWHQIIFAFARYTMIEEMTTMWSIVLIIITLLLSLITYSLIEKPFRNHQIIKTKFVLIICGVTLLLTTVTAFYIHSISGIIKDYPELGFSSEDRVIKGNLFTSNRNASIEYIDDINALDKDFSNGNKIKVLVIGNSFGQDVSNILLEYDSQNTLEVRYFRIQNLNDTTIRKRLAEADKIIIAAKDFISKDALRKIEQMHKITIDDSKVWVFGTKDFGYHNGIHHFRYSDKTNFMTYRTSMKKGVSKINEKLKSEWTDSFVDLISLVSDGDQKVLVYTPDGKFISHDTLHLTKYGAIYFASKLRHKLDMIFSK
jgi:peptidoglycan/LPS O-acetylase OafA/YrhL